MALELVDAQDQRGPTGCEATFTDAATNDPLADREVVISSDGETLHTGQTAADSTLFVKRGTLFGDNPPEGDSFMLGATFDADEERYVVERRENGLRMVLLSIAWFVCSLLLITVGPATPAAYAAVASLRETYAFDCERILTVLKRHGVSAVLPSSVPLLLAAVSALDALEYFAARSTFLPILSTGSVYAAAHATLVLVPTFVGMARAANSDHRSMPDSAERARTPSTPSRWRWPRSSSSSRPACWPFRAGLHRLRYVLLEPPEHEQATEQNRTLYASTDGRRTD